MGLFYANMSKNGFSAKTYFVASLVILCILSRPKVFNFHNWAVKVSIIGRVVGERMFRENLEQASVIPNRSLGEN